MEVDENDGYRYMLTVIDHFSNFPFAYPLQSKTAEEIGVHLHSLFRIFGVPQYLHSDNSGEFINNVLQILLAKYKIEAKNGKPYNPREQGKVEKFNGTLATILAKKMFELKTRYVTFQ